MRIEPSGPTTNDSKLEELKKYPYGSKEWIEAHKKYGLFLDPKGSPHLKEYWEKNPESYYVWLGGGDTKKAFEHYVKSLEEYIQLRKNPDLEDASKEMLDRSIADCKKAIDTISPIDLDQLIQKYSLRFGFPRLRFPIFKFHLDLSKLLVDPRLRGNFQNFFKKVS